MTEQFRRGDVVMVCKHIYEQSPCRRVQNAGVLRTELRRGGSVSDRHAPPLKFQREDGSFLTADFLVKCAECFKVDDRQIDYIEQHWKDGALVVADFATGRVKR